MRQAAPHLIGFVLPPIIVCSVWLGGAWTFLPLLVVYGVLPLADRSPNPRNPTPETERDLGSNRWFRAITWVWMPVQAGLLGWVLATAGSGRLSALEMVGLTLSTGITTGGMGITFAHELIHRPGRFERWLGQALLAMVYYMHFAIEHVHGHHRHVGTPRDSATARLGEPSYAFVLRSVTGGARSAWGIETERLGRQARRWWSPYNRMLGYALIQATVGVLVLQTAGAMALVVFAGQAAVAVSLLEIINYIEHYGLLRREIAPGRYERIEACHSWNSSHRVSNWVLINLARHADHHLSASKRYPLLHTRDEAPQLPAGYSAMMLLALVPPLWRRVMDPRVVAWQQARE
jgi:alkane 1-monooxygenase